MTTAEKSSWRPVIFMLAADCRMLRISLVIAGGDCINRPRQRI